MRDQSPGRFDDLPVNSAALVVLLSAAIGYAFGWLFTVHLVSDEVEAVWATTVLFVIVGLYFWSYVQS